MDNVRELMNAKFATAEPLEAARVAWSRMRRKGVHHLIVVEDGRLKGILSERDLKAQGRKGCMVQDLMVPRKLSVTPGTTLRKAASVMQRQRIGWLPVLENGRITGTVTATDVFEELGRSPKRAPFAARIPKAVKRKAGRTPPVLIPAHIRVFGTRVTPKQRQDLRKKLGIRLGKFADSIERVSLRVTDVNGPRGGVDQLCKIKVALAGLPSVMVEEHHASLDSAMTKALAGLERAVRRSLGRRRLKPINFRRRRAIVGRD